jgi:GNAT superfamily N-acetyltransferase
MNLQRTTSEHPDFIRFVAELDAYLAIVDGDEHDFYHQFNKTHNLRQVVLAVDEQGVALGCGAIRELTPDTMEVKRMYTAPEGRRQGVAGAVLAELERWAAELGYSRCVLETGRRQAEAVALYQKSGYRSIPNYGQYQSMANSLCFEKQLTTA